MAGQAEQQKPIYKKIRQKILMKIVGTNPQAGTKSHSVITLEVQSQRLLHHPQGQAEINEHA